MRPAPPAPVLALAAPALDPVVLVPDPAAPALDPASLVPDPAAPVVALGVLAGAGAALGAAVATLAMIVNIDLYVIGGSVAKCGELLLEPARQAVPHHAFASVASQVRIVASGLDTDAPILGCAWQARQHSQ